jgi:hypothetical protein
VAEHFTETWEVDRAYQGDPMFRPSGTTPGHALEWSRLLVQLWELGGRSKAWMIEAATGLFHKTVSIGWDRNLAASTTRSTGATDRIRRTASGGNARRRRRRRHAWLRQLRLNLRGLVPAHLELRRHPCDRRDAWLAPGAR